MQFVPTLDGDVTTKKNNKNIDPVSDVAVEQEEDSREIKYDAACKWITCYLN